MRLHAGSEVRNNALMADLSNLVKAAEARARSAGLTIPQLCDRAKINRSTWQRWKAGKVGPTVTTWERVKQVLEDAA